MLLLGLMKSLARIMDTIALSALIWVIAIELLESVNAVRALKEKLVNVNLVREIA